MGEYRNDKNIYYERDEQGDACLNEEVEICVTNLCRLTTIDVSRLEL